FSLTIAETQQLSLPYTTTYISSHELFMYSQKYPNTNLYESTPHSCAYYHTTTSYAANGSLQLLGGIPGYPAMTYGLDGEGRLSTAKQGTTNIVCDSACSSSSTTFDPAGRPRVVNIGATADNDTYTYYPNTGRM